MFKYQLSIGRKINRLSYCAIADCELVSESLSARKEYQAVCLAHRPGSNVTHVKNKAKQRQEVNAVIVFIASIPGLPLNCFSRTIGCNTCQEVGHYDSIEKILQPRQILLATHYTFLHLVITIQKRIDAILMHKIHAPRSLIRIFGFWVTTC